MKIKRIGIDIRSLTEGKTTGVEVYTINLLDSLFKIDSENEYVLFYSGWNRSENVVPKFDYPNVKVERINVPNRVLNASFKFFNYPKLDHLLGGLDVFFSPRYLFTALGSNCPLVITTHDLSFVYHPHFFSWKHQVWHRLVGDQRASIRADKIIAVSNSTKRDLINKFSLASEKVEVVYSGLNHEQYSLQSFDLEHQKFLVRRYGLKPGYIMFLGTIEPRKNILGVIDAYEKFRRTNICDTQLVLAGSLGWLYKKIIRRIFLSPNRADIRFLQTVDEKSKPVLYHMASVFMFPSFYEGFGFPPLEAMACGTPVIVSLNSSFPEVLGDACLYVNPYNSESIFSGLNTLLSNEKLRLFYKQKGLMQVRKYSWEETAKKTLKIFNSFES